MEKNMDEIVGKLADKTGTAYISYIDSEGFPVSKAMLKPRKREGIKTFLFTTNTSSNKVKRFRENPKASIYFVNNKSFEGASLTGNVEVLETEEAKRSIWHFGDEIYYPKGVTDPDYCVLKFTAEKGSYYKNFHNEDFEI